MKTIKEAVKRFIRFPGKRKRTSERNDRRPARFNHLGLEALEDRTLLSAGNDLKTYIQDLLSSESARIITQTETISNVSVGNFLQMNSLTLTENATLSPGGVWSGTVGLAAPSATFFPGHNFSGAITSTVANQSALTGTFTIGAGSGADFALSVPATANLVINLGEALTITASNVNFSYNSTGLDSQTLATIQTAKVASPQFSNMLTPTLKNFAVRQDGFSFDSFNLDSTSNPGPSIGTFLTTTSVDLTVSNVNVGFGTTANPTPTFTGSVGVAIYGLQLFPAGGFVQLQSSAVNADYDFSKFDGTNPAGALTLTISGFQLTMGQALQVSADADVVITPGQQVLGTIPSLTLSSPEFTGLGTTKVSNLELDQTGFSIGTLEWASPSKTPVSVANGAFSFNSATVDLNNFALLYGATPSISGSISFNVTGAVLFGNVPVLNVSLGSLKGSFDFNNKTLPGEMHLQISNLNIALGDALTINVGSADLTPGEATMLAASNVNVTANLFSGVTLFNLTTFDITQHGFSIDGHYSNTNPVNLGNFMTFSSLAVVVNNFTIDTTKTPKISGSISIAPFTLTLFPGNAAVNSTFTNLKGQYDFSTDTSLGGLTVTADSIDLNLFNQIDLIAGSAKNPLTFTPGLDTLATIPSASLTFASLSDIAITATNLAITKTGFTIDTATLNDKANLTLGSLVTLTTPTVTLTNINYQRGGTLSGKVDFNATGASLQLGSALNATVGLTTGDYDLSTKALSLTLNTFDLNLAGFADISAGSVALSYTPASDGTSEMLIGATQVGAFMGIGSVPNQVGVNLTKGTLAAAVFDSAKGVITYALDVQGTVNLLGLPANEINITPGNVEFRSNIDGALSTSVTVNGTAVPLVFTGNETDALASGLAVSIGNAANPFASISGDFGFSEFTDSGSNKTYLAIGAENVMASVATGGATVMATGASLGLLIDTSTPANYALVANGGTDSLTGVIGVTLSGMGLTVRVRNGLDASTLKSVLPAGVVTPDGTVALDFSNLGSGSGKVTDVEGTVTLAIANFVSITGAFGFQQFSDKGSTYLAIGGSGVSAMLGTSTTNVTVSSLNFGLIVEPGSTGNPSTYALEATGGNVSFSPPSNLTLSGSNLKVRVRKGLDLTGDSNIPNSVQTPNGPVTLDFTDVKGDVTKLTDIQGTATLTVTNLGTLTGSFGFQSYIDQSGAQQIAIGATKVSIVVGTAAANLTLNNASFGVVIEPGTGGKPTAYALEAKGSNLASDTILNITGLTLTANDLLVEARHGLDLSAVAGLPTIHTPGGDITLDFGGLGAGSSDVVEVTGAVSLTVETFVTLSGSLALQAETVGKDDYLALGIQGSATLTAGSTTLGLTNLTVGIIAQHDPTTGTTYVLEAKEGSDQADTTFSGPADLQLSASNLLIRVKRGLDPTTLPAGVPTSLTLPPTATSATDTATPDFTKVTSISLSHLAIASSLVVTSTLSGTTTTLVAGTDYTLGTDTNGNTTINFLKIPAVGSTITSTYEYDTTTTLAATESFSPDWTTVSAVTLSNPAIVSSLVVTSTPSGGGTPATLIVGTDYTLSTAANGNTKITFLKVPATGSTVTANYKYNSAITLNFTSLGSGTNDITDIEGHGSFTVANFLTLTGDYGIELFTPSVGKTVLLVGATNLSAALGTADTNVSFTGASLGLMVQGGNYALIGSGGTVALNGIPDLSFSASSLEIKAENGLVPSTITGLPAGIDTPGGSVPLDFTGLGSSNITEITGSATISVANFVTLAGTYGFSKTTVADSDGKGTTTKLLVGASGVNAFVGSDDGKFGVEIANASLGLVIYRDSEASGSTYAMQASVPSITPIGLPNEVTLNGAVNLAINTTGAAVNETIPGTTTTVTFADGTNIKSFGGSLTLQINPSSGTSFGLMGDFSFTKEVSNNISKLLVGVANVQTLSGSPIAADGGAGSFDISNGALGIVFYSSAGVSQGYALSASATATLSGSVGSASATLTILRNTTTSAQTDTVVVGGQTIPIVFTDSQKAGPNGAFQTIVVSNVAVSFVGGLVLMDASATGPVHNTGYDTTTLTGVTLTLEDPTNSSNVLFTITAGSAVLNSFTATVTPDGTNKLNQRADGNPWQNGDKELVLTNVSFSIGTYVNFTSDSIDVQHYTDSSNATVNSFMFTNAALKLEDNGSPLVTLSGSPTFHFASGNSDQTKNGFFLDSFTNPGVKFLDPTTTLGPLTLVNPGVSLSNFSFDLTGQLTATVTLSADSATVSVSSVTATFTTLTGSVDLGLKFDLSHLTNPPTVSAHDFKVSAASFSMAFGSFLTLSATGTAQNPLTLNPRAAATDTLISFGTLTATLTMGSITIGGGASNFAIEGNGSFLAETGFGVTFSLGSNASSVSWPSWMPLQAATVSVVWPNFNADPTTFIIELSATVSGTIAGMAISGNVTNAVIDPSLIAKGQFGITSIDSFSAGISGGLFGGTVSAQVVGGVVRFDSKGNVVDGLGNLIGTTTQGTAPFSSEFFAGIEGGFSLGGMAGFNMRLGLSSFGPLQVYVEVDTPIPLGDTGLFITDLRGGITFGASFPPITISSPKELPTDALQLGGSAFTAPDNLTAAQWQMQMEKQVAGLFHDHLVNHPNDPITFTVPSGPFIIQAGLTLYDVSPDVFKVSGDVFFDTTGNFLVIGTMTVGDGFSAGVKVYVNAAPLIQGTSQSLQILFLVQVPAQPNPESLPPIYQIYGFISFAEVNNVFTITIGGEADFQVLNALKASVTATLTMQFTPDSFTITVSNGMVTIPAIQSTPLGTADGSLTIKNDNGTVEIWGGLLITAGITALNPEGIYISSQVFIKLNTTAVEQTVTLSNGTLNLDPQSFSLFVNGEADFKINNVIVFALSGTLVFDINSTSLTIFVAASLLVGNDPTKPIMTFNANGLVEVQLVQDSSDPTNVINPGIAAKMTLTEGAQVPIGITFGENWLLVMNTTGGTVTFTIPDPVPTNPPSPAIPIVMGPDYSNSSNVLALTSYETDAGNTRTLVIPYGAPPGELKDYSNWSPTDHNAYFLVLGRGSVTILNAFTLTGNLNVLAVIGGGNVEFSLDVNTSMALAVNGNTIFSFTVAGGIQISNQGVAAAFAVTRSGALPGGLGFGLSASFEMEVNSTNQDVTIAGIDLPKKQASIQATGDLTFLNGVVDLNGTFGITVSSSSLSVAVTSTVTFLGATFNADGFAAIYYDSAPGLALDISLSLPGGAQGIAPISALGNNFVISGAFELQVNTCSVSRTDPNPPGHAIDPGFKVSVSNLGVYLYGFNLTGSISVGITDAGFSFTVALNLDLFGFANIGINGYYNPDGSFSFTGTAGFQFGDHIFGIGGSISITVSSNGFGASVSGWAAAFGLQISADGSILITGSSVDIRVGFQVTIVPAIHTDAVYVFGVEIFPAIDTPAVVVGKKATYHLGSTSPAPSVAPSAPPPPKPPPLAGIVNSNVLELYLGQDVNNRVNSKGVVTGLQSAENYTLTRSGGTDSSENIIVSAFGFTQTYTGVGEILVNNTLAENDTINIDSAIKVPVNMTLGSGNNTISAGSGPATINVTGAGNNQITTGAGSTITLSATGGSDQVATGANANFQVTGTSANTISATNVNGTDVATLNITGAGNNIVTVVNGAPSVTIASTAGGNNTVQVSNTTATTIDIEGNGNNSVSSLGSGSANVTVNGNGNNAITIAGTAGGTVSDVYLNGSGNNSVTTGAGPTAIYDHGTGGNSINGGSGGGTYYYGEDGNGNPYSSKKTSSISTSNNNFVVSASGYSTYQLTDAALAAGNYLLLLSGVKSITLNAAGSGANAFTLASYSGNATLNGSGSNNTFRIVPGASVNGVNDVLSNASLQVTGGVKQTITLSDIQSANLTGANQGASTFDLSSWTGTGSLTGVPGTSDTLIATDDVALFTLTDSLFQRTGFGDITLSNIGSVNLTGGPGDNTFTVNSWSGNANLDGMTGNNTFNITLKGVGTGILNLADTGFTAADTNTLNVTAFRTTFVTSNSVRVGTQHINYPASGINVVNVFGGAGSLFYDVQSTSAGAVYTVQPIGNSNAFNVGSMAGSQTKTPGVLSGIQGPLTLKGTGQDTANIDDGADGSAQTGLLTNNHLSGLGMGAQGIAYGGLATLNINLGSGNDTFNIQSTAPVTTVNTGTGADTVNVGSQAGVSPATPGILDNVQGALIVIGNGNDALLTDDTASGGAKTGLLTGVTLTGLALGAQGITYSGLATLAINLGSGIDTMDVQGTAANCKTTVDGHLAVQQFFNVFSDASGYGAGTPSQNSSVTNVLGALTLVGGSGPANRLIVSDFANPAPDGHVVVTSNSIGGLAPGSISYSAAGSFTDGAKEDGIFIQGPNHTGNPGTGSTFDIRSTLGGSTTAVESHNGNNTFNVSSDADNVGAALTNNGNIQGVAGTLTIDGGSNITNQLIISNFGGSGSPNVLQDTAVVNGVSYERLTGFAPATIYYTATGGGFFQEQGLSGVLVRGSSTGNDTFAVHTTLASSTTVFQGNGGTATYNIDGRTFQPSGPQSGLQGLLILQGNSVNDLYNITISNGGSTFIEDGGGPGNHAATITNTAPNAPFHLQPGNLAGTGGVITWNNNLKQLTLQGVSLAAAFGSSVTMVAAPNIDTAIVIDGTAGGNPAGLPRVMDLDLSGLPPSTMLHVDGPGMATLETPGYANLSFVNFDRVTSAGGKINLLIDGNSDMPSGLKAGDGTPKTYTAHMNGTLLELDYNGVPVYLGDASVIGSINVQGTTDNTTLDVDNSHGLVVGPINYNGGTSGDRSLIVNGGDLITYTPSATTSGSGTVVTTKGSQSQTIAFQGLTPMYLFNAASAIIALPNNGDNILIDSPLLGSLSQQDQSAIQNAKLGNGQFNRITGSVKGVAIEPVYFGNITDVTLDGGSNNVFDPNGNNDDTFTITSSGLVAAQLKTFKVLGAAAGNDTFIDHSSNYALPVANGGLSFVGGKNTNTVVADAAVNYVLTNAGLSSSGGGSIGFVGINVANLTGSHSRFDVSGWSNTGSLTDTAGTIVDSAGADYTLSNSQESRDDTNGHVLALSGIVTANLTDTTGGHTFTLVNWSGNGSLVNNSGVTAGTVPTNDILTATAAGNFALTNTSLTTNGAVMSLTGLFKTANLTETAGGSFDLSGWTHGGTLTGAGTDTVSAAKDADFTLTNTSITSTDQMAMGISGITVANLTGTGHPHNFTLDTPTGLWTGTGALNSTGGNGTVYATRDADFALANGSLATTDGMSMTLAGVGTANLTGTQHSHTFTLDTAGDHWTGNGALASSGGNGTVNASRDADFTLANGSLATTDGMSMTLSGFGTANLTGTGHPHTFTLDTPTDKWTGTAALTSNGGNGTVNATRDADFTLANGSLATADGMSCTLVGIGTANLTSTTHAHTFNLDKPTDKWTGNGSLTSKTFAGTIVSNRNADFTLANGSLATTDGLAMTLSNIGTANLTGTTQAHTFTLNSGADKWSGQGTLTNQVGNGVVVSAGGVGYTLTNTSLNSSDGMAMTLSGFGTANLTDTAGGKSFDVGGWTGTGMLTNISSPAVADTVIAGKKAGFTLTNSSLTSTDGMSLTLNGPFGTANLTDTQGGNTFMVSGWTGAGSLINSGNKSDSAIATKNANFTLANTSLSSSDGMSLTLSGISSATLTDLGGGHSFTVGGWTGTASLTNSGATSDTIASTKNAGYTLTNTSLTSTDGMNVTLSGPFGTATLVDQGTGHTFTVSGWTGGGSLTGSGGGDTVVAGKNASFVLSNANLSSTDGLSLALSGITTATLTDTGSGHDFTVSGWTGTGSLTGSATDTVIASKSAGYILTNTSLASIDHMALTLSGIGNAKLTDVGGAHSFIVGGWTKSGSLTNSGPNGDTVIASKTANYMLTNSSLTSTDGMSLTLSGISTAKLTDLGTGNTFTVSGWTGGGSLTGNADKVVATKNANFTLANTSLSSSDGMSLALSGITSATLTDVSGGHTFTIGGWTGTATLTNSGATADTLASSKNAGYTLTNTSLTSTDGMNVTLSGPFNTATLADQGTGHTFTVSGWTGGGSLTSSGGDTVVAGKNASFVLTNANLSSTDGMSLALSGISAATLTDAGSGHDFTVSGWTGTGSLTGSATDTVIASKSAGYILTNTSLASIDHMALTLSGIGNAKLTDVGGAHSFIVGGWTKSGTLTNSGPTADTVIASKAAGYTLTNSGLTSTDGMNLALIGFGAAGLTDTANGNTFTVSGWTGGGSLTSTGAGGDKVVATKNGNFTFSNAGLSTSDGMALTLSGITSATLTDVGGGHTFTVGGWTGVGSLTNTGAVSDALSASKNANFTLTNSQVQASDGMNLSLAGIHTANLAVTGADAFTVSGWTGVGSLTGAGNATVNAGKDASVVLTNALLTTSDGMNLTLAGVATANLVVGPGADTVKLDGWTGSGGIAGAANDVVNVTKAASFTLTNSALASNDGMHMNLAGIHTVNLTSTAASGGIDVGGWTGTGTLSGSGATTVVAAKDTSFNLSNTALATGDGMHVTLSNIGGAKLTGGPGNNQFTIGSWTGIDVLDGNGGVNSYSINLVGAGSTTILDSGNGSDTVTVNDLPGNDTVSIGADQLTRGLESVHYAGSIANLIFNDPTGVHTYNATSSPGTALTVNGSGQDTLNFDATGLNETIGFNTITAPGRQPFTFNGIQHLIITPVTPAVQADSFVRRIYPDVLGRNVDASGLTFWVAQLLNNTPYSTVATDILTSAEHRAAQINAFYEKFLGRAVDAGGLANWLNQFKAGATEETVEQGILSSAEFMNAHASNASFLTALYQDVFNRNPDPGGFAAWSSFLNNGVPRATVIADFLVSDEYRLDAIDALYLQFLHRKADAGAQHWLQVYDSGSTQDAIAANLLASQEYLNDR